MKSEPTEEVFACLDAALKEMRANLKNLEGTIEGCSRSERRTAIRDFEKMGYHLVKFNPFYVVGQPVRVGDVQISPVSIGANGCPGKSELKLEYEYAPSGYSPNDLFAPPGTETDNFNLIAAKDTYAKHFKTHLCLSVDFRDRNFVMSRNVSFDAESLPLEIERFKKDVDAARFYIDRDGRQKVSGKYVDP